MITLSQVKTLPASDAQQRLWFINELLPDSPVYNIYRAVKITGKFNPEALQKTLNAMIVRHETLRTTFHAENGQVMQAVHACLEIKMEEIDLRGRNEDMQAILDKNVQRPFDLINGPLLRACLLKLEDDCHVFQFMVHHIIFDRRSLGILNRELTEHYRYYDEGVSPDLPDLEVQYSDYSMWRNEKLNVEDLSRPWTYWQKQLTGLVPLTLPYDHTRSAIPNTRGDRVYLDLPDNLIRNFEPVVTNSGATLFMGVLAVFYILIHRWSGETNIMVGSPYADRRLKGSEDLFGFFVSSLIFRTDLSGDPTFGEVLARVKKTCFNSYRYNAMPLDKIVERLNPERHVNRTPLFDMDFQVQKLQPEALEFGDTEISDVRAARCSAAHDLGFAIREKTDGYDIRFEFREDLFERSTMEFMLKRFSLLLDSITNEPGKKISEYSIVLPEEQHKLELWNNTERDYGKPCCLQELFESQVEKTPDSTVLVFEDEQLTYRELNSRANRLAHFLRERGVGADDLVAVCMERSIEMVIALYGIHKAGAGYVPLDPDNPPSRLCYILEDIKAPVVLSQQKFSEVLHGSSVPIVNLDTGWDSIADRSCENPELITNPENLAYVIYTSGSTGNPKGVMIEHKGIVSHLRWMQDYFQLDASDRVLQKIAYTFDPSVPEFFWATTVGAQIVLAKPGGHQDYFYLADLIERNQVTTLAWIPSLLQDFISKVDSNKCTSLKRITCGGEVMPVELPFQLSKFCKAGLYNVYGPTEAVIEVSCFPCPGDYEGKNIPIGKAIANTQLHILDDNLCPVPIGSSGELYIGGVQIARGYLNQPELTSDKFIHDPFSKDSHARLYKTGDLARYQADGQIEYIDRFDFQVKIRGLRVELGEIEARLNELNLVKQCVVIVREDIPGDKRIVAYFEPSDGVDVKISDIRHHLRNNLPSYMVPQYFVELQQLPLTTNEKIDRNALPEPSEDMLGIDTEIIEASTDTEKALVKIWRELIGIENISIGADFFDLGGHSLLTTQMVSMIVEKFDVEISLSTVFQSPRIKELGEYIDANFKTIAKEAKLIVPKSNRKQADLSHAQQRLWFLDQLEPLSPLNNIPVFVKLSGQLNHASISRFFNALIVKHEILRTRFINSDDGPQQIIDEIESVDIEMVEMYDASDEALNKFLSAQYVKPFDLSLSPIFRVQVITLSKNEHILSLVIHHSIFDGWSVHVLLDEFFKFYRNDSDADPASLTALKIQYADFAEWQNEWIAQGAIQQQQEVWMEQLAGQLPTLTLPTQLPRPPVFSSKGAIISVDLEKDTFDAIQVCANKLNVTVFMYLLSTYYLLLYRYCGQDDIVIGVPIANRNMSQIEPLIGFFVNTLPLRNSINEKLSFVEFLAQIKQSCLTAFDNQDVPFEKLVADLHPERDLSRTPIFQTIFNFLKAEDEYPINDNLTARLLPWGGSVSKTDLSLTVIEKTSNYRVSIEYCSDLFNHHTIESLLGRFTQLLGAVILQPDRKITDYSILLAEEEKLVISDWNDNAVEYPQVKCLNQLFEDQVAKTPDLTVLEFDEVKLSYRELNEKANQLAHYLREQGVGREIMVAVCMERSIELVIALYAIHKAGGAYVPLDPEHPPARIAFMLKDIKSPVVLTQSHFQELLAGSQGKQICLDIDWSIISKYSIDNPPQITDKNNLAYVIYTSGSTGTPKGVMIDQSSIVSHLCWLQDRFQLDNSDCILQKTTYSFDPSIPEFFWAPLVGARIVIAKPGGHQDVDYLANLIEKHRVTTLYWVPSMLQVFIDKVDPEQCTSLRRVTCGGEVMSLELQTKFMEFSEAELLNVYGPTEAVVAVTYKHCRQEPDQNVISIGRPVANTQIYLLDEQLRPVPLGCPGELYIGGVQVARGYLNQADLTAERFVRNPFSDDPENRIYRTGDLAKFRDDGQIDYIGRVDFQVKIRGLRIELGEIEARLGEIGGIKQNVVVVREDQPGDKRIVAYYESNDNCELVADELRQQLKASLPSYMIPQYFVEMAKLPLTSNEKVDRKALPEPSINFEEDNVAIVEANTETEKMLTSIWGDLIGIDKVSIDANFFDLGGHSLLAMQAISEVKKACDVDIPVALMISETLVQIAANIDGDDAKKEQLKQSSRTGSSMPFYFGEDESLFGHYSKPAVDQRLRGAVLLCNPIFMESINAHWAYRRLAAMLVNAGFHVLRFDYFATGNSSGEDDDACVDRWIDDINAAANKLRELSDQTNISMVGLRYGAILATNSAVLNIDKLVLWEPTFDGNAYVSELYEKYNRIIQELNIIRKMQVTKSQDEIIGYKFPLALRESISNRVLEDGECLKNAAKVSLITSDESFAFKNKLGRLEDSNTNFRYVYIEDSNPSISEFSNLMAYLPGKSLTEIVNIIKEP